MNKEQLRDRTRQLSGAELEGLRSDPEVDVLVEEAYQRVGNLESWKWRETTAEFQTEDGTHTYDVPATVREIRGVTATGVSGQSLPVPLSEVTLRDLLTRIRRDDTDLPRYYARTEDSKIRLGPIPGKVYDIEVYGLKPLDGLENDTDEPEWDSQFHAAIAYLAAAVLLDEEGQQELAERRLLAADNILTDMIDYYQTSKDTSPVVVGGGQMTASRDRLGRLYPWR